MFRGIRSLLVSLTLLMCVGSELSWAGPYDPLPAYYAGATGTGSTLKAQLQDIIDNHTPISYDGARSALQVTDRDPNDSNRMLLVYDRVSLDVSVIDPNGPIPGWDLGASWNREHTWPRSRNVGTSGPDNSDLHQLRPSTPSVNGARGNLNFGGAYGQPYGAKSDGGTVFYPGDADAGMIARQEFYMAVRYDASDANTTDLELFPGNPTESVGLGNLTRLLEWHYQAVPDVFELRRNHIIDTQYQHNRNPFVDHPEFAWSIFVDQQNDSRLYVGAGPDPNGASSTSVSLGSVLVGSAVPAGQNVTLNKAGLDGVYYEVTTSGDATSSVTGRYNAFKINSVATDSRTLSVGLDPNADTSSAGLVSGAVAINNLDITTSGGAGRGARDQNDTINVSLSVLDHANPSFLVGSDENVWTIDFGTVTMGATLPTTDFTLANLVATTGFTAKLDFDSFSSSGDDNVLTTNLATFTGGSALTAGSSNLFTATLDTANVGNFAATYTLNFSDENLTGATSLGSLTLNLLGEIIAAADNADFDNDDDVDGVDFLTWQQQFGTPAGAAYRPGDANGDGLVDDSDLVIWEAQYGPVPPLAGLATVPEPTTATLLLAGCLALFRRTRRS